MTSNVLTIEEMTIAGQYLPIRPKYNINPTPGGTKNNAIYFSSTPAPLLTHSNRMMPVCNARKIRIMPVTFPGRGKPGIRAVISPIKRKAKTMSSPLRIFRPLCGLKNCLIHCIFSNLRVKIKYFFNECSRVHKI